MATTADSSSKAVLRALSMLEAIAESEKGLTNAELSKQLSVPKSTASYLLHALEARGYLHRAETTNEYTLGLQILHLSHAVLAHMDLRKVAVPHLARFVEKTGLPAHLAILERGRAVYVEKVEAEDNFVRMDTRVGKRVPVHTTAIGKVLTAPLPDAAVLQILEERGMERHTAETMITPARFLHELEKVRRQGYAQDNEENSLGVRCLAAPVQDAAGKVIAAVGTSGTTSHIHESVLPGIIAHIQRTAQDIASDLGYTRAVVSDQKRV